MKRSRLSSSAQLCWCSSNWNSNAWSTICWGWLSFCCRWGLVGWFLFSCSRSSWWASFGGWIGGVWFPFCRACWRWVPALIRFFFWEWLRVFCEKIARWVDWGRTRHLSWSPCLLLRVLQRRRIGFRLRFLLEFPFAPIGRYWISHGNTMFFQYLTSSSRLLRSYRKQGVRSPYYRQSRPTWAFFSKIKEGSSYKIA